MVEEMQDLHEFAPLADKETLAPMRENVYHGGMIRPTDHRAALYDQLVEYSERHPERADVAKQMLRFVCHTPDCFERSHLSGHITGSAWLLSPNGSRALLTLHRKLGLWLQPGGHADGDADTLRVALREAEEESGISGIRPLSTRIYDVDIHRIPAHPASGAPEHLHYDVRYLLQAPHERICLSEESVDLAWFTPQQLAELTPAVDESVLRLCRINATA